MRKVSPLAISESQRSGIPYQVYLGIAANETGWGGSSLATQNNNYFSIKGQGPAGGVTLPAWEVVNGQNVTQTSTFRSYADPAQSFSDFSDFLHQNPRYQPALDYLQSNPNDWRGFVHMLNDEGYATDPDWADKVISIGSQYDQPSAVSPASAGPGVQTSTGIQSVIDVGSQAIGQRYQFGGAGGRGQSALSAPTDCSGFVSWAYETATGIRLPAQTQGIYASTMALDPKQAMPGDLVMYNMGQGANLEHVGIYMGNGMMLHDSSINPDGGVDVTPIWSGAEFRRVPGVDPSLVTKPPAGNQPAPDATPTQWVIAVQHGHFVWTGATADGTMSTQDMGPTPGGQTFTDGQVVDAYWMHGSGASPQQGDTGGGNEALGAGQDEGDDSGYVDDQGNPVSQADVNQIALTSQRRGEQIAGYQNQLDTPGQGYQVPTSADVTNARNEAQNEADQANIQDESQFLARQQPAPATVGRPTPDVPPAPPVLTRPAGQTAPANAQQPIPTQGKQSLNPLDPTQSLPQTAPPQTGFGTSRQALPPPQYGPAPVVPPTPPLPAPQIHPTPDMNQPPPQARTAAQVAESGGGPMDVQGAAQSLVSGAQQAAGTALQIAQNAPVVVQSAIAPLVNMSPENQARLSTAAEVASDLAQPGRLAPGVLEAAQNVYQNGFDPGPALNKLLLPPDPGTASAKAVSGQQLSPLDAVQLGMEWQQKLQDYRADLVRAAQSPAQLGTPEGEAAAQGIAMVTDPMNFVGLGKVGAGRTLLEEGGEVAVKAANLSDKLEPLVAPVMRGVERTLATPYDASVSRSILQQAALDIGGDEGTRLLNNSRAAYTLGKRIEPLSGEQLRRTVVNAIARANPDMAPGDIIAQADETLRRSAPELTSEGMAMNALAVPHVEGLEAARLRWYDTPQAQAAYVHELGQAMKFVNSDSGAVTARVAVHAMGAGVGALATSFGVDPDDPYRNYKIAGGALVGGLAPLGLGWAAGHYVAPFVGETLKGARELLAPIENRSPEVRDILREWAGNYNVGSTAAHRLADEMRGAFGKGANLELAKEMEEKGRLPFKYMRSPAAQEFLRKWKSLTAWAVKYDIVPDEINFVRPGSKAKMYVPHAVQDEMNRALEMGQAVNKQQHSRLAVNPFDYYNQPRIHATLQDGEDAGVKYAEDIPRTFGNYYATAVKRAANQQMVDKLMKLADKNNPSRFGPAMQQVMLKGEDVVQLPQGWTGARLTNAVNISHYMPQFRPEQGIFVSKDLGNTLNDLFNPSFFDRYQGLAALPEINNIFKHNVLGGSAFHLINEVRQVFATQGWSAPKNLINMVGQMTTPGGARKFWSAEGADVSKAIQDGLMLNLAADKPAMDVRTRFATMLLNSVVGGVAGYQSGTDDQERQTHALMGAAAGFATGVPIPGMGKWASVAERFSSMMWDRYIPFMKYTTYQMYAPQVGGRAAAEFANEVFGGQNLLAIGRSRTMQDAMKLLMLAPDWQEGWARQIGNAVFSWGPHAPLGDMNRSYWKNAAFQSVALLEGMNLAFGGHLSMDNDPDAVLMVDASQFYDRMGWQHRDPTTGNVYKPYWDVLGPYRSMLQPLVETARAATAAGANALGIQPGQLPFDKEIRGKFGEVPESDPGTAWKTFLGSRVGFLPALGQQVLTGRDWAGRPLDQPDDGVVQRLMTRVSQAASHMIPTGEQQVVASGQRGDPTAVALFSSVTGQRVKHESDTNRYFAYQDQYVKDLGKTPEQWQDELNTNRDDNNRINQDIELIQSGLKSIGPDGKTLVPAEPGQSNMTPHQRDLEIQKLNGTRKNEHTLLENLIPQNWSAEDKAKYAAQLKWLGDKSVVGGSDAPADFDFSGRPDLDPAELMRLAWNRDPDEIARITGTQAPTNGPVDAFGRTVQNWALHPQADHTATQELAQTRARWTTETALTWNVDPAVVQDMVKANLYGLPNGQLPLLPGVTSAQLNDIAKGYQDAGEATGGVGPVYSGGVAQAKQDYIFETAGQLGVDPQALETRVRLRTLPMADQTPSTLQRSNALDPLNSQKAVPFQNPDGSPMGTPDQWKDWETKLVAYKDKTHYSTKTGLYYQNGQPWDELNKAQAGKQQAQADRFKLVIRSSKDVNDPASKAYAWYRNFGDGANLTDAQWQQYQDGTLPMWTDNPSPTEAKRRVSALRTGAALTRKELQGYQQVTWQGPDLATGKIGPQTTTLGAYLAYIKAHTSKEYLDLSVGPSDDSGVE